MRGVQTMELNWNLSSFLQYSNIHEVQVNAAKGYSQISFSAKAEPHTTSVRDVIRKCYSSVIRVVTHGKEVLLSICPPCYVQALYTVRSTTVHIEKFIE